jgi:regulator of protease activity HflC (stomatin/prohibitin superfamily)
MSNVLLPALLAGAAGLGTTAGAPFLLLEAAKKDLLVSYLDLGDGKFILRGRDLHDIIINLPGSHLNRPGSGQAPRGTRQWEIISHGEQPDDQFDTRPAWMRKFGYYWIGIPGQRSVRVRKFEWKEESALRGILNRTAQTKVFKVNSFPYVIEHQGLLSKDDYFQVQARYAVDVRITNPFIALVDRDNWLVQLANIIEELVRNWVGSFTFKELVSQTDGATAAHRRREDLARKILALNDKLPGEPKGKEVGARGKLGITIDSFALKSILPFGPAAEAHMKLLNAPFEAEQEAKVTVTNAEAEAKATEATGLAGARVAKANAEAAVAGELATLLAAQKHPEGAKTVYMAKALGGATVIAMPTWASEFLSKIGT